MCVLAGVVSRAGYYRRWQASAPRQEEIAVRDAIQCVVLANRRYGFRRVAREMHNPRDDRCLWFSRGIAAHPPARRTPVWAADSENRDGKLKKTDTGRRAPV
jgi:hypothetical protein